MFEFANGCLIQEASELPQIPAVIERLFADFETSSGSPKATSVNPWRTCTVIGAGLSFGDDKNYFIPRHLLLHNGYWAEVIRRTKLWVNHNVKYDAHVSKNDLGVDVTCNLRCTIAGAKLIDSDRMFSGGYGLDVLSKAWLDMNIDRYEWQLKAWLGKSKDYGDVPLDVLADYGLADIEATKRLNAYIEHRMPQDSADVWAVEQGLTHHLYEMEQLGVYTDPRQRLITQYKVMNEMVEIDTRLAQRIGHGIRAHVNDDCHDVLCNMFGLPILGWTETKQPSFDKDTLKKYLVHPLAPQDIVSDILRYRKLNIFNNLFLDKFADLADGNGVLHPTYNQNVRTGRMSCSDPNMQQMMSEAKWLVIPPPGHILITADYSQIEFRVIVHYIKNRRCIDAYIADPWVDFHNWVRDMCSIKRKAAKTVNFMMGFGGGKKRTVQELSNNSDVVGEVVKEVDAMGVSGAERVAAINRLCALRAETVYATYHQTLPELKPTSREAENAARARGYVRNHYGRRRHLSAMDAHKAFNSACQSTAGDMIKERMIALGKQVPEFKQAIQVHDQLVGYAPAKYAGDLDFLRSITDVMNQPSRPLSVPVRATIAWSASSWGDASQDEKELKL